MIFFGGQSIAFPRIFFNIKRNLLIVRIFLEMSEKNNNVRPLSIQIHYFTPFVRICYGEIVLR